jgi:hypothetical protein
MPRSPDDGGVDVTLTTQLLTNLPATPMSQLDHWLPDRWKLNHATQPG